MSDVINRGSCLPAVKATKAELAAELEAVRDLLRAIDELILPPRPAAPDERLDFETYATASLKRQDAFLQLQRDRALEIQAAIRWALDRPGAKSIATGAKVLRASGAAELPYPPE